MIYCRLQKEAIVIQFLKHVSAQWSDLVHNQRHHRAKLFLSFCLTLFCFSCLLKQVTQSRSKSLDLAVKLRGAESLLCPACLLTYYSPNSPEQYLHNGDNNRTSLKQHLEDYMSTLLKLLTGSLALSATGWMRNSQYCVAKLGSCWGWGSGLPFQIPSTGYLGTQGEG